MLVRDPIHSPLKGYLPEDLMVKVAPNNLQTCLQYSISDSDGKKLLNIKFYDKLLELISRDGTKSVGSRVSHILGSLRNPDRVS